LSRKTDFSFLDTKILFHSPYLDPAEGAFVVFLQVPFIPGSKVSDFLEPAGEGEGDEFKLSTEAAVIKIRECEGEEGVDDGPDCESGLEVEWLSEDEEDTDAVVGESVRECLMVIRSECR